MLIILKNNVIIVIFLRRAGTRNALGSVILLVLSSMGTTGLSMWKETALEFQSGQSVNTTMENGGLVLANNSEPYNLWSKMGNVSGPQPRYQHSMAYDSINGVHILYGGYYSDGPLNDAWAYNISTNKWTTINRIPDPTEFQGHLNGQAMAFDEGNGTTVMVGGHNSWIQTWDFYANGFIYNYSMNRWTDSYNAPSGRALHSMAYDPGMGHVVLFGGQTYTGNMYTAGQFICLNDTWSYNSGNRTWTNQTTALAPPPRHSQCMCYDPASGLIILFGGRNDTRILQDTWTYDPYTNIWSERHPAIKPPALYGAVMAEDPINGSVILFGGQGLTSMSNDTWSYNATRDEWTRILAENGPSPRCYSTMTFDTRANKLFLFAGREQNGEYMDDYWTYDPLNNSWSKQGELLSPMPRWGSCTAFDSAKKVGILFGGVYGSLIYFNDTWAYDASNNKWTDMRPKAPPPPREGAAMCYDSKNDFIVLFGGDGEHGYFNDTWVLNASSNTWTNRTPFPSPSPGEGACMDYDPVSNQVVLFGGGKGPSYESDETWTYNVTYNIWTNRTSTIAPQGRWYSEMVYDNVDRIFVLFGGDVDYRCAGDTWIFNTSQYYWTQMKPFSSPSARYCHAMAYDSSRAITLLFGGSSGVPRNDLLGDTWAYDYTLDNWMNLTPAVSPAPSNVARLFYDSYNKVEVLFSGYQGETWLWGLQGRCTNGTYTSLPKDTGGSAYFGTLEWNAAMPADTSIRMRLRTGATLADMEMNDFCGPDGNAGSLFTQSGQRIPAVHNGSRWIQYRIYLSSESARKTPILYSVTINYNLLQNITITAPVGGENWTGLQNVTWVAHDDGSESLSFDIYLANDTNTSLLIGNLPNETRQWSWDTGAIPNGTYRIKVMTHDNNPSIPLTVNATSGNFTVFHPPPPNHPPHVNLVSPINNSKVNNTIVLLTWTGIDVDGDPLTYTCLYCANSHMLGPTRINLTDQFLDISNLSDNTTYYWAVSASDGKPETAEVNTEIWSFTVRLPPANIPVRFTSTPSPTAWVSQEYTYNLTSIDEDGDIPFYALLTAPSNVTLDSSTGKLHWTPATSDIGNHTITIQVSDGRGGLDNQTFTITVKGIPPPPVIPPKCAITYPANGTTVKGTIKVLGTASNGSLPLSVVKIRLDNGTWTTALGLENWTFTINTAKLAKGNHRIEAKSFAANLYSETVSVNFTVNNPSPGASIGGNQWCLPAIAIALVAGIAVLFLRKKRKNW